MLSLFSLSFFSHSHFFSLSLSFLVSDLIVKSLTLKRFLILLLFFVSQLLWHKDFSGACLPRRNLNHHLGFSWDVGILRFYFTWSWWWPAKNQGEDYTIYSSPSNNAIAKCWGCCHSHTTLWSENAHFTLEFRVFNGWRQFSN